METKNRIILVPIVFKAYSLNICKYALALAEKIEAEIKLFHVFKSEDESFAKYGSHVSEGHISTVDRAEAEIEKIRYELEEQISTRQIQKVTVSSMVVKGSVSDEIVKISEKYEPHLVILGTKGEEKKSRALIGSLTTKVIERINNTVLAIPEDAEFGNFENLDVLYATDFNDSDHSSLQKLLFLLAPFNAKVNCVHVETSDGVEADKIKSLESFLKTKYDKYNIKCILKHSENLIEGIKEYIESNQIDLISFTSHRKTAFQRLFKPDNLNKLFFYTNIPLLVFRV